MGKPTSWEAYFDSWQEFEETVQQAASNAKTGWEMSFISDMQGRVKRFGVKVFISEQQAEILHRLTR